MTNIQVGDRVRVRKGECLGHEGYVRSVGTSDGGCTAYVSLWAKYGWLASPALPFDWLELVLDKGSGNLFKVGDVVKSITHQGWDEGLVVNVYDAHNGERHCHQIIARHHQRNHGRSVGVTTWNEGAVAFVKHIHTVIPKCKAGDRVQLFGDDREGVVKQVTTDGLIRLDGPRGLLMRPSWDVLAVIQPAAPAEDPLIALTKLPLAFTCCACRNSFQQQEMEHIKADGDAWGTCKKCFNFLWTAGVEKKRDKRLKITERKEMASDVRAALRIDKATFVDYYGHLLHAAEVGRNFAMGRGGRLLAFEVMSIEDVPQIQFFRGAVPFGDPHSADEAASKVYTFIVGGPLEESF